MSMSDTTDGRILLVDDERLVRFTISTWLKASHFEVTAVATPTEAMSVIKESAYDAVVSDVMMGDVDGFMLRDAVRRFDARIPFVFLTALVETPTNQLQAHIAEDQYSTYVAKNARKDVLLMRIRQAVRSHRAEHEAEALRAERRRDLEFAARVQNVLLPAPVIVGREFFCSALSHPFDIVSGDFCHWHALTERLGMFVFGDISGHGTSAALAMAAVVSHLKGIANGEGVRLRQPHVVCREIDSFIRQNLRDVCYLSGTVLFVNLDTNKVRYLNAGGMEPLCFSRTDGSRIELNPDGRGCLPMGMMENAKYDESAVVEAPLDDDSLLCLYSDGYADVSSDEAGTDCLPQDVMCEVIGELVRSASGTADFAAIPYRLNELIRDMGFSHRQDDMNFVIFGRSMIHALRFLRAVPMRDSSYIDQAVAEASQWTKDRGYPDEAVVRLELLLDEHLQNVRKHGMTEAERMHDSAVVEMRPAGDDLEVCVWNRGAEWHCDLSETAPHPDVALNAQNDALAGGGRGIAILRKLTRRIAYERFDGLNKFTYLMRTST